MTSFYHRFVSQWLLNVAKLMTWLADSLRRAAIPDQAARDAVVASAQSGSFSRMPEHIAFIMDGNRRHARQHGRAESDYRPGLDAFAVMCRWCAAQPKILRASFFALSTENVAKRGGGADVESMIVKAEVDLIAIAKEINAVIRVVSSSPELLSSSAQGSLARIEKATQTESPRLRIDLLVSYGGRDDIVQACRSIVLQSKRSGEHRNAVGTRFTEEALSSAMVTAPAGDPDLIVRTAEQRLSNFTMWQGAYSELVFLPDVLWPEMNEKHLHLVLEEYNQRQRRFGA